MQGLAARGMLFQRSEAPLALSFGSTVSPLRSSPTWSALLGMEVRLSKRRGLRRSSRSLSPRGATLRGSHESWKAGTPSGSAMAELGSTSRIPLSSAWRVFSSSSSQSLPDLVARLRHSTVSSSRIGDFSSSRAFDGGTVTEVLGYGKAPGLIGVEGRWWETRADWRQTTVAERQVGRQLP